MPPLSLWERLFMPAVLTGIFALLSAGFMVTVGGATRRMKVVLKCAILFAAGMTYSMAWHEKLAQVFGWDDAWIIMTILVALGSIFLARRLLAGRSDTSHPLGG